MDFLLAKMVDENVPKDRWIVSLSNGETIFENYVKGEPPAWARLSDYIIKHDLDITGMRVQIMGLEMILPSNQPGYIQKKKVWSTGSTSGGKICAGWIDTKGNARIDELGSDKSSFTYYPKDPGPPWTIYNKELRDVITE